MIRPVLSPNELLDQIREESHEAGSLRIWWLGQSGFLLQLRSTGGTTNLLVDPYLSDSLTRKYADTDKPHVRMTDLAIDPGSLDMIDVVTSSHNHTDHLDGETLTALMLANSELSILVPAANVDFAADRLAVPSTRLLSVDAGEEIDIKGIKIHAVPAAHEAIDRDESGRCHYLGYVFEIGSYSVYHSGDTLRYDQQDKVVGAWNIDVAILPINGRAPERRVAGNLNGEEAAQLAHDIGASLVIPCHYEMFEFNTASPQRFEAKCQELGQRFRTMRCGESITIHEANHAN